MALLRVIVNESRKTSTGINIRDPLSRTRGVIDNFGL